MSLMPRRPPPPTLFPYTTLFRSQPAPLVLPRRPARRLLHRTGMAEPVTALPAPAFIYIDSAVSTTRSEEHTSELQSRRDLVCRLLLEKKNTDVHVALVAVVLGEA